MKFSKEEVLKILEGAKDEQGNVPFTIVKKAIEKLKVEPEWTSVAEKLPKEHICEDGYVQPSKYVLVIDNYGNYGISRYWGNRRSKPSCAFTFPDWMDLDQDTQDVIAWTYLPKQYKAENEE